MSLLSVSASASDPSSCKSTYKAERKSRLKDIKVSIVIPAYNESVNIERCIQACLDQTVLPFEILVIDNKSTDDTFALAKAFEKKPFLGKAKGGGLVKVLRQDEFQGLVPTRNFGLDKARGDVLGRIDADAIIKPNWVETVTALFEDDNVMGATGPCVYYDMPGRKGALVVDDLIRKFVQKRGLRERFMFGTNMAMRRSAWQAIRGEVCIDEEDVFHEDVDISLHYAAHNFYIEYSSEMIAGMSARRINDRPSDFLDYQKRFERTYVAHGYKKRQAQAPKFIFMTIYFPLHMLYKVYTPIYERRLWSSENFLWREDGKMSPLRARIRAAFGR